MSTTYTKLRYHVFFSTQDERPRFAPALLSRLQDYIGGVLERHGATLLASGGTADHLHLLLGLKPSHSLVDIVRPVKAGSSRWLNRLISSFGWQRGYAAFSVNEVGVADVKRYIRDHSRRHETLSFPEELRRFLDLHGMSGGENIGPTYSRLTYHFVFSTKNRLWLIAPEVQNSLYSMIGDAIRQEGGELIEIGGMPDHIHVLARMEPRHTVVRMMKMVKGRSSRRMNETGGSESPFAWQAGYGAFTVSESQIEAVRCYIQNQEEHHRAVSFSEEFRVLIKGQALT